MEMENLRKGPWFEEEDDRLRACVAVLGERRWDSLAKVSGLRRSGKSCRLRWLNYLRPSLKQGPITPDEELIILQLHEKWGNKWSKIAQRLPGRTDNEIKNYWRTHLRRKMQSHMQSTTHLFPTPYNNNVLSLESSSSRDQTHNFNQDSLSIDEGDTFSKEVNSNDNQGELVGPYNNHNTTPIGASNYGITSSPYDQSHLSHWISSESNELIDELSVGYMENNGSNLCFDYQVTWNVGYGGAWDNSDNLWDVDFISANFA